MILGRYIVAALGLSLVFLSFFIKVGDRPFEKRTAHMINLGRYDVKFKYRQN